MKKILYFMFFILILSFGFAYDFPGNITTLNTTYTFIPKNNNVSCLKINLNFPEKSIGIKGIFLHISGPKVFQLSFKDNKNTPIVHKSVYGVNIAFYYTQKDFQNNWLFVNLNNYDANSLKICVGFKDQNEKLKILKDTKIGYFKIPYFKLEKKTKYKIYKSGEKTPIIVYFKNIGYDKANIKVFYDNQIFTRYFKLKEGNPSWIGTLDVNEDANLIYYFVPLLSENFVISPAFLVYNYKGYKFITFSNNIVVGPQKYLNTINCDTFIKKLIYFVDENAKIEVYLYNDSLKTKDFNLVLKSDNFIKKKNISLKPNETKTVIFSFTNNKEDISEYKIFLEKNKKIKICNSYYINFTKKQKNIINIFIFVTLFIALGIYGYYKYLL